MLKPRDILGGIKRFDADPLQRFPLKIVHRAAAQLFGGQRFPIAHGVLLVWSRTVA